MNSDEALLLGRECLDRIRDQIDQGDLTNLASVVIDIFQAVDYLYDAIRIESGEDS